VKKCLMPPCSWVSLAKQSRAPGTEPLSESSLVGRDGQCSLGTRQCGGQHGSEDLFDQLAHEQEIAIFCSFLMDNFDGEVHTRMLPRLGQNHSHLIPVLNYVRLERAVADALREIVGPVEANVLEKKLLEHYAPPLAMPSSQALLFALRQALPDVAGAVLERSGSLYHARD
jgi:hypothetical protein